MGEGGGEGGGVPSVHTSSSYIVVEIDAAFLVLFS